MTMKEPPEYLSAEAKERIHVAKNLAQADEIARQEQAARIAETTADLAAERVFEDKRLSKIVHEAVMRGFSFEDGEEGRRFIDVTKEKLICQSIVNISGRLDSIEGNLTWTVRIVLGAVILAVLGLIFVK